MNTMKIIFNKLPKFFRAKWFLWTAGPIIAILGIYFIFFHKTPKAQFVTVEKGSVSETVSITGNTTPAQSVALTFGSSGTISRIYSALGVQVSAGQILAELNTNDLAAGLRQAEANVASQQAKLEGLKTSTRPEDIAASQAALDKAKQDLANMYGGISDTSADGYAKANDAVRTQIDTFFSNGETSTPKLTYTTGNYQAQIDAETQRFNATNALGAWQDKLVKIDSSNEALEALLQDELSYLAIVRQLLNSLSKTLNLVSGLSAATLDADKGALTIAVNEVNTATKNLNAISQNIASQKLSVAQLQAQLDLKRAGSLPTDISAQEAQVQLAQASVDSARAKLQNAQIVAPISGVVTQFDAKVGQQAVSGTPLVSIMSNGGYEVDAGVSETDVGKVLVGDTVSMVLDAFQNEIFMGKVFYIAPAETNTQGVINYLVKISFSKPDIRLKSGLTANIEIQTKHKDKVLVLPQYAILQNDEGTFVETLENGKTVQHPVKLGIQDQKGNVEILSGVTEGEQVLNIGLKVQ